MWFPRSRAAAPAAWSVATLTVCLVAGLLIGTARSYSKGVDIRNRSVDLSALVTEAQGRVETADARAVQLQQQIAAAAGSDVAPQVSTALQSAKALEPAAGLTPVHGEALRVTLTDAPRDANGDYPSGVNPDDLVVHQQDVQAVVNALWAGGASAMMIMDQRVVNTSAVRCIGNTLLFQGRTYSPPFVITALGDPASMVAALDAEPGVALFRQYVDRFGLGYDVSAVADATLPGYTGVVHLTAAQAVTK